MNLKERMKARGLKYEKLAEALVKPKVLNQDKLWLRNREIELEVQQTLKIHGKEAALRRRDELLGTNAARVN